jgi:hypothetical protein
VHPLHRVSDHATRTVAPVLAEHQPVQLSRFRGVGIRHQMSVAVERRLDRGMAELGLDVLRVCPLGDQEAGVRVAQVVKPDASQIRATQRSSPTTG